MVMVDTMNKISESENLDPNTMDYLNTTLITRNETSYISENDSTLPEILPQSLTSAIFLSAPPKSNTSHVYNSSNTKDEFQLYVIGIYSFFAAVFGFGLIVMFFKKLHKACCTKPKSDCQHRDYESVPYREDLFGPEEENLAFDSRVNLDAIGISGGVMRQQTDPDSYSNISIDDRHYPAEKPPAYEDPPSYSIVSS